MAFSHQPSANICPSTPCSVSLCCSSSPATRSCTVCGDCMCQPCCDAIHSIGDYREHDIIFWRQSDVDDMITSLEVEFLPPKLCQAEGCRHAATWFCQHCRPLTTTGVHDGCYMCDDHEVYSHAFASGHQRRQVFREVQSNAPASTVSSTSVHSFLSSSHASAKEEARSFWLLHTASMK